MVTDALQSLTDDALLARLVELLRDSRRVEADLVAHIAEVDARQLYLREACSSMFSYCVERLRLSEPETGLRIYVARAARRHPALLQMLRDGRLHLSGVALLAPHLTAENRDQVLARAAQRTKAQLLELIADIAPRPDVPPSMRKLPPKLAERDAHRSLGATPSGSSAGGAAGIGAPGEHRLEDVGDRAFAESIVGSHARVAESSGVAGPSAASTNPAGLASSSCQPLPASLPTDRRASSRHVVEPLAPGRYRVQFTASAALRAKLERLQVLMARAVPDGDLAVLIEAAVTERIERLERQRLAATMRPRASLSESDTRPGPRHIPAAVKRVVRERDGDQCAYVDRQGRRCSERRHLQFHHRLPHALGGDRTPRNIARYCARHNAYEALHDLGPRVARAPS